MPLMVNNWIIMNQIYKLINTQKCVVSTVLHRSLVHSLTLSLSLSSNLSLIRFSLCNTKNNNLQTVFRNSTNGKLNRITRIMENEKFGFNRKLQIIHAYQPNWNCIESITFWTCFRNLELKRFRSFDWNSTTTTLVEATEKKIIAFDY